MSSAPRMSLTNVVGGVVKKPVRVLVYGVDGIGKTTLASAAPSPVFIGLEDGTAALNVKRYPEPHTWGDLMFALDELATADHSYKTVVIDTLDWIEPLCWAHVVGVGKRTKQGKVITAIDDFDFGMGYNAALGEWRILLSKLDRLRADRGMASILVAHAWIKGFKNPEGSDFDRFEIKLNAKAGGLIREWADVVLFATHEQYTYGDESDKSARAKGITTGARIMYTSRRAAFDAKNRYSLPEVLPLDWQSLEDGIAAGQTAEPATIRTRITALLEGSPESLQKAVAAALERAGDNAAELARIANKLTAQLSIQKQNTQESGVTNHG